MTLLVPTVALRAIPNAAGTEGSPGTAEADDEDELATSFASLFGYRSRNLRYFSASALRSLTPINLNHICGWIHGTLVEPA